MTSRERAFIGLFPEAAEIAPGAPTVSPAYRSTRTIEADRSLRRVRHRGLRIDSAEEIPTEDLSE